MKKNNKIVNAGIRLTRNCNMKCRYCNIQNTNKKELSLGEWKKAIKIMKNLGANKLVLLGGEPTIYPDIIELVNYVVNDLKMVCNLTTNAYENFEIIQNLLDLGLNSIGVSIDTLKIKDSISPLKAKNGLDLIDFLLKNNSNPSITNYTVLNKSNVNSIIETIEFMNDNSVSTYILPFHWGNEGVFDHRKNDSKFAFTTDNDVILYNQTINKIIELKKKGYKIINSYDFLEASKQHIKNLSWKCEGLSELRIDSDGMLVCCCDKIGIVNNEFSIFDLEDNLEHFFQVREEDSVRCEGCLWPSSFEAQLEREVKK